MLEKYVRKTLNFERIAKFFMDNGLEFSENEPVPTDMIDTWEIVKDDFLIGAITLSKREGEFIIDGIAVDETYRKKDVGTYLLDIAIDKIKQLGGNTLFLVARAPGFFKKLGFENVSREDAPLFFECFTCPQYGNGCSPEVLKLNIADYKKGR